MSASARVTWRFPCCRLSFRFSYCRLRWFSCCILGTKEMVEPWLYSVDKLVDEVIASAWKRKGRFWLAKRDKVIFIEGAMNGVASHTPVAQEALWGTMHKVHALVAISRTTLRMGC